MTGSPNGRPPGPSYTPTGKKFGCQGFAKSTFMVPDTQVLTDERDHSQHPSVERFTRTPPDLPESHLNEGFSYSKKEPPRPGQFSGFPAARIARPLMRQTLWMEPSPPMPAPLSDVPPPFTNNIAQIPLDLHEISLQGADLQQHPGAQRSCNSSSDSIHLSEPVASVVEPPVSQRLSLSPDVHNPSKLGSVEDTQKHMGQGELKERATNTHARPSVQGLVSRPLDSKRLDIYASSPPPRDGSLCLHIPHQAACLSVPPSKDLFPEISEHPPRQFSARGSAASGCGDLEQPVQKGFIGLHGSSHQAAMSISDQSFSTSRRQRKKRQRPESQTSNISRKRSAIHKTRLKSESHRKNNAMRQVAQYWNECIRIADEEKKNANRDMSCLLDDICLRDSKLKEAHLLLKERETELHGLREYCREMKEKDQIISAKHERLEMQVVELNDELSRSKGRSTTLTEKYRAYKRKLNETIAEHQDLYRQARAMENSMKELSRVHAERVTSSEAVDIALQNSYNKREEMRKCLEELQLERDRESQQKCRTIEELKETIQSQETSLVRQKEVVEGLRCQIEAQQASQETLQAMASKLDTVLELRHKSSHQIQESERSLNGIQVMLSSLMQHTVASGTNQHPPIDLERKLQDLHDSICRTMLPVITDLEARQNRLEKTITTQGQALRDELTGLRRNLNSQRQISEASDSQPMDIKLGLLRIENDLRGGLVQAQKDNQEISNRLCALTQNQTQMVKDNVGIRDIMIQYMEQNPGTSDLERRCLVAAESCLVNMKGLKITVQQDGEISRNIFQKTATAICNLQDIMVREFERARKVPTEIECKNRVPMTVLSAHSAAAKENPAGVTLHIPCDNNHLQKTTQDEKGVIYLLQQKIYDLEQKVKADSATRERWLQDIGTVKALRLQLQLIQEQVPIIATLCSRVDHIVHLNKLIQSTATYFSAEGAWVGERLSIDSERTVGDGQAVSAANSSKEYQTGIEEQIKAHSYSESEDRGGFLPSSESSELGERPSVSVRRKVMVYSPTDANSSYMPPSVEQEQRHRRKSLQPRSILKLSSSSALGQDGQERASSSRYTESGPSVMSETSESVFNSNEATAQQILGSFVTQNQLGQDRNLPTLMDFERHDHSILDQGIFDQKCANSFTVDSYGQGSEIPQVYR